MVNECEKLKAGGGCTLRRSVACQACTVKSVDLMFAVTS